MSDPKASTGRELEGFRQKLRRHRAERPKAVQAAVGLNAAEKVTLGGDERLNPMRGEQPQVHHDLLFFGPGGVQERHEMVRFPVRRVGEEEGRFIDKPEYLDYVDWEQRRVDMVAHCEEWGTEQRRRREKSDGMARGAAFGTLPVKPEPSASSCGLCYLVNAENLNFRNAWTADEWVGIPGGENLEASPLSSANEFDLLIGAPRGQVLHLKVRNLDEWPGADFFALGKDGRQGSIQSIDLRLEAEVWNQLRNGVVAGRVGMNGAPDPLPLVNVTSLMIETQGQKGAQS